MAAVAAPEGQSRASMSRGSLNGSFRMPTGGTLAEHVRWAKSKAVEAIKVLEDDSMKALERIDSAVDLLRSLVDEHLTLPEFWGARRSTARMSIASDGYFKNLSESTQRWIMEEFSEADLVMGDIVNSESDEKICQARKKLEIFERPRASTTIGEEVTSMVTFALSDLSVQASLAHSTDSTWDAFNFCKNARVDGQPVTMLGAYLLRSPFMVPNEGPGKSLKDMLVPYTTCGGTQFFERFLPFLHSINDLYRNVEYHNSLHAASTMGMMVWLMQSQYMSERTTAIDQLMGLAAAAIHDVGHPGVNQHFLEITGDPLATRYNDSSVLENMHLATAFEVMRQRDGINWFELIKSDVAGPHGTGNARAYCRKGIIRMVLSTDMAKHFAKTSRLTEFAQESEKSSRQGHHCDEDRTDTVEMKAKRLEDHFLLLESCLHMADLGNACKPHDVMMNWSRCILEEMWDQGQQEHARGLPISPMCDKSKFSPAGQVGFYKAIVVPFMRPLSRLMAQEESIQTGYQQLKDNLRFWEVQQEESSDIAKLWPDEEEQEIENAAKLWLQEVIDDADGSEAGSDDAPAAEAE